MRRRVLVADDRPGIRKLLHEVISMHGYEVETAPDGYQALEKIRAGDFQLVLLDMKMSGLSGLETLRAIKQDYPHLKVIIMTAYQEQDLLEETGRLGACCYMVKPFDMEELLSNIERCLKVV